MGILCLCWIQTALNTWSQSFNVASAQKHYNIWSGIKLKHLKCIHYSWELLWIMCCIVDLLIVVWDPSIQPFSFVILSRVVGGLDLGEKTKRRRCQLSIEYKHNMFITRPVEEKTQWAGDVTQVMPQSTKHKKSHPNQCDIHLCPLFNPCSHFYGNYRPECCCYLYENVTAIECQCRPPCFFSQ